MWGYILCYASSLVKDTKNWTWFLQLLMKLIDNIDDLTLPLILEKQKGLIIVLRDIFPKKYMTNVSIICEAKLKQTTKKWQRSSFGLVCTHTWSQKHFILLIFICHFLMWNYFVIVLLQFNLWFFWGIYLQISLGILFYANMSFVCSARHIVLWNLSMKILC